MHFIRVAQYAIGRTFNAPIILDLTDAGSLYLKRFLDTTKHQFLKLFLKVELRRLQDYERVLNYFDRCLVCSNVDKEILQQRSPDAKIDLLYNGIDLKYFTANGSHVPEPFRIICTGNMSYFPNLDGALYFSTHVFPLVKKKIPEAKLYVVGQAPPKKLRRIASDDIIVTGFVRDIKEYYLRSVVAIAPIRFGAGTLNKILEPMALGIPVVATSIGVKGLSLQAERDVLVADNVEDFAAAVIRLLKDPPLRHRISENAKTIVRSLYDWEVVAQTLQGLYVKLIQDHAERRW